MRFAMTNGETVVSLVEGDGAEWLPGAMAIPEALAGYPIDRLAVDEGRIVLSPEGDPPPSEPAPSEPTPSESTQSETG